MSVTDKAIRDMRQMILSGQLPAASKLPAESELAAQFGVSRGTMREAVRALTYMGLVDVRRGDGSYVTRLDPSQMLKGVRFAAEAARDTAVLDVMEVRKLLEPAAAAIAASRMGPDILRVLHTHLDRMREFSDEPEEFVSHDAAFHDAIATATGNSWLASLLRGLAAPTIQARRLRVEVQSRVPATTIAQHEEIYNALEAGDPELARATAFIHVADTARGLQRLLYADGPSSTEPDTETLAGQPRTNDISTRKAHRSERPLDAPSGAAT